MPLIYNNRSITIHQSHARDLLISYLSIYLPKSIRTCIQKQRNIYIMKRHTTPSYTYRNTYTHTWPMHGMGQGRSDGPLFLSLRVNICLCVFTHGAGTLRAATPLSSLVYRQIGRQTAKVIQIRVPSLLTRVRYRKTGDSPYRCTDSLLMDIPLYTQTSFLHGVLRRENVHSRLCIYRHYCVHA